MNITLHMTNKCNLACDYCYVPKNTNEMNEEIIEQSIRYAMSDGSPTISIVFFGGEPLMEKPLIEHAIGICRSIEKKGRHFFHLKISTNGTLLDEETLKFLKREQVLLSISMDGNRSAHDTHRKFPDGNGSFDLVDEKASLALEYHPYATALSVITPQNAGYVCESSEYLLNKGFKYIISAPDFDSVWDEKSMSVLERQYRKLSKIYIEKTRDKKDFYLAPFEEKLASHICGPYKKYERCELGIKNVSIAPDGSIFPCIQFVYEDPGRWCIGDVWKGIDTAKREAIYTESEEEKESCTTCEVKGRCRNWCGCLNWHTTGNVNKVSPTVCAYERMITPIADSIGNRLFKKRTPLFIDKFYNAAYPFLALFREKKDI
ncbi:MAG: radical SAM protein [Planctomycetota bacterium]|nr:MAG: radical SAM protein [Planctomycetota bacterium]